MGAALVLLLACLWAGAARGSGPDTHEPGRSRLETYRTYDRRLERKVTLRAHRVPVGQVLELLTARSGVRLRLGNEREGAGDDEVSLALPAVPLHVAMDALWSLLSYRKAEFEWRRMESKEGYVYQFWRTRAAQELPTRLEAYADARFRAELALLHRAATAAPAELQELASRHEIVRLCAQSRIILPGVRLFMETLDPNDRESVLAGGTRVRRPVEQLPDYGKDLVRHLFAQAGNQGTFGRRVDPVSGPSWVEFYVLPLSYTMTRTLFVEVEALGAHGYVGGTSLDRELSQYLRDRWMLPGDTQSDAAARKPIGVATPEDAGQIIATGSVGSSGWSGLAGTIRPLARQGSAPFIIRAWRDDTRAFRARATDTWGLFQEMLCKEPGTYHGKWRDGVLLLTTPSWYRPDNQRDKTPWPISRQIRTTLDESGGLPGLDALCEIADLMRPEWLAAMEQRMSLFGRIREWRPVLTLRSTRRSFWGRLRSEAGVPVAEAQNLGAERVQGLLSDRRAVAVRLHTRSERPAGGEETRYVVLQSLRSDGAVLREYGFEYRREPPWGEVFTPAPAD